MVFSEKTGFQAPSPGLLFPLYIYPAPGAWDFLHEAIHAHPRLNFTIVINPGSGPGPLPLPDANYAREIPRLASKPNVRILGYIACTWAAKPLASVLGELATYAQWRSKCPSLGVQGVFLDEAPSEYDPRTVRYLETINATIKASEGMEEGLFVPSGQLTSTAVMNPGVFPDSRYMALADVTVVFEDTHRQFSRLDCAKSLKELAKTHRSRNCVLMHSITDSSERHLEHLVDQLHDVVGFLFLTDLSSGFYASKSVSFPRTLDALSRRLPA
ncbi:hypothetical protein K490DRAFT_38154 [Saccharata proteae CBS 121410]|uniref:Cell surface spherulin 4-like protein n=1 Tax=Saccharata proteae CBS 121410 TaxID=1314787 RepID=A0A6A5YBY6_9PEZI|nr:hypothetical protein K490DRAFT_38154 [Saccharata proteae CBS 121410]